MNEMKYEILHTESGSYETTLSPKFASKEPWSRRDPRQVLAFLPGTIISTEVVAGDKVEAGDKLLMFSAMKMDNSYASPIGGTVARVNVAPGQVIAKGDVLVEFE